MKHTNPGCVVDIIIEKNDRILLIKRKNDPFKGMYALPGGFLENGKESLEQAAKRELEEETSLIAEKLELFNVYSNPNRDPRGHIISHVYFSKDFWGELKANDDAKEARYFSLNKLPRLAFDHGKILEDYIKWKKK